jgi:hypothetical protein
MSNNLRPAEDLQPGHPRAAYDQSWSDVQPLLVNEAVTNRAQKINPMKELY